MNDRDNRIVSMEFDNSNFERNVKTSMSTIDKLNEKLEFKGAGDGLANLEKMSGKVDFSALQNSIQNIEKAFTPMGMAFYTVWSDVIRQVEGKINEFNKLVFQDPYKDGFKEYELKMGSVQTIMASTKEPLEKVNQYLEELNAYSDRTIYSFSDMTNNIGKFTNAGVKLEDAVAAIKGISNEAAISGANANEASRAMYNFSQALSSGVVRLIDWKSIENANMATVEFKQELLNTAVALGTVRRDGDKFVTTTTDMHGGISDAFDAQMKFNDSLSHQWLTSDVLIETLKRYTDETTDLGQRAYAAATEVKTFSMMMDTLKESMGSGWAQTFELIIGDFNEAKDVFTKVTSIFDGMIQKTSTIRNNIIRLWDATGGREKVLNTIYSGLDRIESKYNSFLKMVLGENYDKLIGDLNEGLGETSDAIQEITDKEKAFAWEVWNLNNHGSGAERRRQAEELGLSYENVQKYIDGIISGSNKWTDYQESLNKTTEDIKENIEETKESIEDISNGKVSKFVSDILNVAKNIGKSVVNIGAGLSNIASIFVNSLIKNMDYDKISGGFLDLSEVILDLSERFRKWTENNKTLEKTFEQVFGVINVIISGVGNIYRTIKSIFSYLYDNYPTISKGFENAVNNIANNKLVVSFWNGLKKVFNSIKDIIWSIGDALVIVWDVTPLEAVSTAFEKIKNAAKELADGALNILKKLFSDNSDEASNAGDKMSGTADKMSESSKALNTLKDILVAIFTFGKRLIIGVGPLIVALLDNLGKAIMNVDFSDILRVLKEGGLIALLYQIISTINNFKKNSNSLVGSIIGIADSIRDAIDTNFNNDISTKFLTLAKAIALVSASIFALAMINPERLQFVLDKFKLAALSILILIGIGTKYAGMKKGVENTLQGMDALTAAFADFTSDLSRLIKITAISAVIAAISTMILAFVLLFKSLYSTTEGIDTGNSDRIWATMGMFAVIVGSILLILHSVKDIESYGGQLNGMAAVLIGLGKAMIGIALSIGILTLLIRSGDGWDVVSALIVYAGIIGGIFAIAKACSNFNYSGKSLEGLGKVVTALGSLMIKISIAFAIMSLVNYSIGDVLSVIGIIYTMAVFLNAISDIATTKDASKSIAKMMKSISSMILTISISLAIMSSNMLEDNFVNFIGIIGLLGVIFASIGMISNGETKYKNLLALSDVIKSFTVIIAAFAAAIYILRNVDSDVINAVSIGLIGMLSYMAVFSNVLSGNKDSSKSAKSILTLSVAMLALSAATVLLAESIDVEGLGNVLLGMTMLASGLLGIYSMMVLMENTKVNLEAISAVLILSTAILSVAAAMKVLGSMNLGQLLKSFVSVVAIIITFIGVAAVVGAMSPLFTKFTYVLNGFAKVLNKVGNVFLKVTVAITLISLAIAVLGALFYTFKDDTVAFKDAVMKAIEIIYEAAGLIAQVGLKILAEFIKGLIAALPDFVDALGTLILTLVKALDKWVYPIAKSLLLLLLSIANTLVMLIGDEGGTLAQIIINIVWAIFEIIEKALAQVLKGINLGGWADGIIEDLESGAQWFHDVIASTSKDISNDISELSNEYTVDISTIFDFNSIFGDGLQTDLPGEISRLKDKFGTIDVRNTFMNDKDLAIPGMDEYMSFDISEYEDKFKAMGSINANSYTNAFNSVDGYPDGYNLSEEALDGMYDNLPEFEDVAEEEAYTLSDQFVASSPQTYEEGQLMSQDGAEGIKSQDWRYKEAAGTVVAAFTLGLSEKAGDMWESGRHMARSFLEGFDGYFYMKNESNGNLLYDRGKLVGERLIAGLSDASDKVNEESYNIAKEIKTGITNELDDIEPVIHASVEVDPFDGKLPEDATLVEKFLASSPSKWGAILSGETAGAIASLFGGNKQATNTEDTRALINKMSEFVTAANKGDLNADNYKIVLDSGTLVGEMVGPMNDALGDISRRDNFASRTVATRIK